jgi:lipopolysaccharide biosynthesis glycosyltransferase
MTELPPNSFYEINPASAQSKNFAENKVAVIYICDAPYHDLTVYSLASFAGTHKAPLDFFLMQREYHAKIPATLEAAALAHGHRIFVRDAPGWDLSIEKKGDKYAHISTTTFLKAKAIDELVEKYDYIIYIDGDILIFDDLHLETAVGFAEVAAACPDLSSATGLDDPDFLSNCARSGFSSAFFNAGFFIVNGSKWRSTQASARYLENLYRHETACPYFTHCGPNDQCPLNMTLGSDLKRLPVSWNVQKSALHTQAWEHAIVRHYTGPRKFLPVRAWTCDRREYALLKSISAQFGLPAPEGIYDGGVSYRLNKIRRRKAVAAYEQAISAIRI